MLLLSLMFRLNCLCTLTIHQGKPLSIFYMVPSHGDQGTNNCKHPLLSTHFLMNHRGQLKYWETILGNSKKNFFLSFFLWKCLHWSVMFKSLYLSQMTFLGEENLSVITISLCCQCGPNHSTRTNLKRWWQFGLQLGCQLSKHFS